MSSDISRADAASPRSDAHHRAVFDSMDLGYVLIDVIVDEHDQVLDLFYVDANPAAIRMSGAELVGRTTRELSPDLEPHWFETFARVARTGVGERHELTAAPLNAWYELYVFKVGDPGTRRVAAVYQDVTERKRSDISLQEHALRRAFLLALSDATRPISDPAEVLEVAARLLGERLHADRAFYVEWNDAEGTCVVQRDYRRGAVNTVAGVYRDADFTPVPDILRSGRTFVVDDISAAEQIIPAVRDRIASYGVQSQIAVPLLRDQQLVAALFVQHAISRAWTPFEVSLVQDTAERTWSEVIRAGSDAAVRASELRLRRAHDELEARVTERTAALAQSNAHIKALLKRLLSIQEEERRRIARDVHDQLGQQITALRMYLEAAQLGASGDADGALVAAARLAMELDDSVDFLTWQLRPAMLDVLGLSEALEALVTTWSRRFQVPAAFDSQGAERRLPPDIETNLYRIAQEALHNVYKHAHAGCVIVSLNYQAAEVILAISDDGCGFDIGGVAQGTQAGHLGLVTMRERAILAGGDAEVLSTTGGGTTIRVRLPS